MNPNPQTPPNHSLLGANLSPGSEPPKIYAVVDLRAYVKPPLSEELGSPAGAAAPPATPGTEVVCSCVPVEDCACNVVRYNEGSSICPTDCTCEVTCGCQSTCTLDCECVFDFV